MGKQKVKESELFEGAIFRFQGDFVKIMCESFIPGQVMIIDGAMMNVVDIEYLEPCMIGVQSLIQAGFKHVKENRFMITVDNQKILFHLTTPEMDIQIHGRVKGDKHFIEDGRNVIAYEGKYIHTLQKFIAQICV